MLSLLYEFPESGPKIKCLQDLAVDQIISTTCVTKDICDYVVSVLEQPLQHPENVVYRQEICRDFYDHPELFRELTELCRNYSQLKSEWDKLLAGIRSKASLRQSQSSSLDLIRDTIAALEANALYCSKITAFPEELLKTLNNYPIKSQGLNKLKTACESRLNDPDYRTLRELAQEFTEVAPMIDKGCEISFEITESLQGTAAHLIKLELHDQTQKKRSSFFSALFNRSQETPELEGAVTLAIETRETRYELVNLINDALKEVSTLFVHIIRSIYPEFVHLADELWFYRFALRLKRVYEKDNKPFCFPTITPAEADVFECMELYDLLLLVQNYASNLPARSVVPNDIKLAGATTGILVQGDNSSGKTTFLRSIGTAQVLAQAGLPIPSRSAVISIRRQVLAQFSGEDTISISDSAGRFESEVIEVAEIIAQLEPYSLVLFNETFQTTAFDEAAPAIYDILDVISTVNIKWIFVTHLLQLYEHFSESERQILFLQTSGDPKQRYKLEPMELNSSA